METKETYALLISGNELVYMEEVLDFYSFLLDELNFDAAKIRILLGGKGKEHTLGAMKSFLDKVENRRKPNTLVLLYVGHGNKEGLSTTGRAGSDILTYEELGDLIMDKGSFIFINECCYSGNAIDSFKKKGLLPTKGLVITSVGRNNESSVVLSYRLIESYRNHQVFMPSKRKYDRIRGEITFKLPEDIGEAACAEERVMKRFKYLEVYTPYKKPIKIPIDPDTHPQRCGKTLDYILFKDYNLALNKNG